MKDLGRMRFAHRATHQRPSHVSLSRRFAWVSTFAALILTACENAPDARDYAVLLDASCARKDGGLTSETGVTGFMVQGDSIVIYLADGAQFALDRKDFTSCFVEGQHQRGEAR